MAIYYSGYGEQIGVLEDQNPAVYRCTFRLKDGF